MKLNCFRKGLDLDGLILVLSFELFWSTFVKMADFQGIKDSSDIFLLGNNFLLMRLSKPSTRLSLFFSLFDLLSPIIRTFSYNRKKFFIFDLSVNPQLKCAHVVITINIRISTGRIKITTVT